MSDSVDVTVVCVPKKGKTNSTNLKNKFSLKEHLEACRDKLNKGTLTKIQIQAVSPTMFPQGEVTKETFKHFWDFLERTGFWTTDKDRKQTANMATAQKIVHLLIGDMRGRSGLGNSWDGIDGETQNEIRQEWAEMIARVM